jgi:hypothetical protein
VLPHQRQPQRCRSSWWISQYVFLYRAFAFDFCSPVQFFFSTPVLIEPDRSRLGQ